MQSLDDLQHIQLLQPQCQNLAAVLAQGRFQQALAVEFVDD
jgi:hypothetical protein